MKVPGSVIFALFLLAISLFFTLGSFRYGGMAEFVPLVLAIPTGVLTLIVVVGERYPGLTRYFEAGLDAWLSTTAGGSQNPSVSRVSLREAKLVLKTFGWFVLFGVLVFLAGFYVATALFALLFMRFQGRIGWVGATGATLFAELFFYAVFERILQVNLFSGILFGSPVPPL